MSGTLLADFEIVAAIDAGEISVSGLARDEHGDLPLTEDSAVQASSLDLTIGRIFLPPDTPAELTAPEPEGETGFLLDPGHTVVIETREEISLASNIAAFGFPPARLSRNSILMTNPGHVDPGYSGRLRFTVINMGRDSYSLKHEDKIVSLLVFRFPEIVKCDFAGRNVGKEGVSSNIPLLNMLSPDFASFASRMEESANIAVAGRLVEFERETNTAKENLVRAVEVAKEAEGKFSRSKLWVPGVISLIVAIATIVGANVTDILGFASNNDLNSLKNRVKTIETTRDVEAMRLELRNLKEAIVPLLNSQLKDR